MSRGPAVLVPGPLLINKETELVDKVFCKQLHPKRVIPLSCKDANVRIWLGSGLGHRGIHFTQQSVSQRAAEKFRPSFFPSFPSSRSISQTSYTYAVAGGRGRALIDLCLAR